MFIGRGFDTDGDGDNDFFVGSKVSLPGWAAAVVIGITFLGIGVVLLTAASDEAWANILELLLYWVVPISALALLAKAQLRVSFWLSVVILALLFTGGNWVRHTWTNRAAHIASQKAAQAQAERQAFTDNVNAMRDEILRKAREKAEAE